MKGTLIPALILCSVAFPDTALQTDWSGGPGVEGPVLEWDLRFASAVGLNWDDPAGQLRLGYGAIDPEGHPVISAYAGAFFVRASDIDGDGDMDLVGSAYVQGDVSWWENSDTAPGVFISKTTLDDGLVYAAGIHSADIDDDGDMDVLGTGAFQGEIALWRNLDGTGSSWQRVQIATGFLSAWSVYAGDMDGDGDMDVLGAAHQGDVISWWENINGSGTSWSEHIVEHPFDGACSVFADDMDGDGDLDVLGAGRMADEIVWWENTDGTGTAWIRRTVREGFDGACSVLTGDIDSDGDADVVGAAYNQSSIVWWENTDGTGLIWDEHTVDSLFTGAFSVFAADIDDDGLLDLAGAARDDGQVAWYRNVDGAGTQWDRHVAGEAFEDATCVTAADLDGDGLPDIAGAAFIDDEIAWWKVADSVLEGVLASSILDTDTEPDWGGITWVSSTPSGTDLCFQVRSSDDIGGMGAWSDTIWTPGSLDPFAEHGDRYIQYRTILLAGNPGLTPVLEDITVSWDPLGIHGTSPETGLSVSGPSPNPAPGVVDLRVMLDEPGHLELGIYDLSGRLAAADGGTFPAGESTFTVGGLSPGIYFVIIRTEDLKWSGRFTIVR